jgi:hypothetical protein
LSFLLRAVQDEWAVCKVFNKELQAARSEPLLAAAGAAELERVGSLGFLNELLDSAELPALVGADVDEVIDFKGPAPASVPDASYLPVKMEEHALLQMQQCQYQPPPPMFYPSQYFSLPAMNSGHLPPAIRRYCKAEQQVVSAQTASVISPSRETGLSTDPNAAGGYAEISSAATPSSSHQFLPELDDPALNLADLWKY